MSDRLESQLQAAGRVREDADASSDALRALAAARADEAKGRGRRRVLVPVLTAAASVAMLGTTAVAASQWGPWTYVTEPDIVIARDWTDVYGVPIGSCESRLAADELNPELLAAARSYLDGIDVDSVEPNAEYVASMMVGVGRPDDLGQLIAGADVDDFDITHTGPLFDDAWLTDARILQDGLTQAVFIGLDDALAQYPESDGLAADVETQCSGDQ